MTDQGKEGTEQPGPPGYLRLGEAQRRGQLHALRRGQVALDLEALLQARELRVGEDGAGLAAAAVLAGQLGVRVRVRLEEAGHGHACNGARG